MKNYNHKYNFDYSSSSDNCVAPITNDDYHKFTPLNMKVKVGINMIYLDSGTLCSFVAKDRAKLIIKHSEEAKWLMETKRKIKIFPNEPVTTLDRRVAPIECNIWSAKNASFVIVRNELRPLIRGDLFETLGIFTKQPPTINKIVNCINTATPIKEKIAKEFPGLTMQIYKSKNITFKSNSYRDYNVHHQK